MFSLENYNKNKTITVEIITEGLGITQRHTTLISLNIEVIFAILILNLVK